MKRSEYSTDEKALPTADTYRLFGMAPEDAHNEGRSWWGSHAPPLEAPAFRFSDLISHVQSRLGSGEPIYEIVGEIAEISPDLARAVHQQFQAAPPQSEQPDRSNPLVSGTGTDGAQDSIELAQGEYRVERDEALAGANKTIRGMLRRFAKPGQIVAQLEKIRKGLGRDLAPDILEASRFRRANPQVPIGEYKIDVEHVRVPMTSIEQLRNEWAQSGAGAAVMAAGDVTSFGLLDELANTPEMVRYLRGKVAAKHPYANALGTAWGTLLTAPAAEAAAIRLGAGRFAPAIGDGLYGAAYGAGSTEEDRLSGALLGGTLAGGAGQIWSGARGARNQLRNQEYFESQVQKHIDRGWDTETAVKLAEAYKGWGHHQIPRNRKVGPFNGAVRLPEWYVESPFNVLKPKGISKGDFYDLHYRVDPSFHGARLPGRGKGQGWSGKKLGLERYGRAGRLWHGTPGALKKAAAYPALGGGLLYWSGPEGE